MISFLSFILLVLHSFPCQPIVVDNTSLVLVIIILISPFLSAIRKIKFGDFEAEIDPEEVSRIRDDVDIKLSEIQSTFIEPNLGIESTVEQIKYLCENDPVIALAKLRIEIEKVVTRLYDRTQSQSAKGRVVSLGKMVHDLVTQEILPNSLLNPTLEVVSICNRAIHGEDIRDSDARTMLDIGTSLLERLFWFSRDFIKKVNETVNISQAEVQDLSKANYRLVSIVPYVEKPIRNIRILDQAGLNDFFENYNEYAEFVVEITRIK